MQVSLNLYKPISYSSPYLTSFKKTYGQPDTEKISRPLDKKSPSSKFFGVTSREEVITHLYEQARLSQLKCKEQNIIPSLIKNQFNIDDAGALISERENLWKTDKINDLWDKGAARFTFAGNFFGNGVYKNDGVHTIGLVVDKQTKTLFVLDSLPESVPAVSDYRKKLKNFLFVPNNYDHPLKFDKIIFSTRPQQNLDEYCCNNWTHANIEAVQKELKSGRKITSQEELNAILPDNINKILDEQRNYLLRNISPNELNFLCH